MGTTSCFLRLASFSYRARDEAHRFGIAYHRLLRKKKMKED